jgi:hypothetical protein
VRRKLLGLAGALVILGSVAYVAQPTGHVPPFDANLVRLAESELEGYCSGEVFWDTGGNAAAAAACRAARRGTMSEMSDLAAVSPAFCRAVVDSGWDQDVAACLEILESEQLWPTYDGGLSDAWNRARPYPQAPIHKAEMTDSRTGGHTGQVRVPPSRGDPIIPVETTETETETTTDTTATTTEEGAE